jgi:thiol-disulfide isomerase/thioredoxin
MLRSRLHPPFRRSTQDPRVLAVALALLLSAILIAPPLLARSGETADEVAAAPPEHPACRPSPETETALADLDLIVVPDCSEDPACVRTKIEETRRVVTEQPDNVHLQRNLQDLVMRWYRGEDRAELRGRLSAFYARRAEEHPDNPVAQYLHGRMVERTDQRDAFRRALEVDPDFPWAHLGLAAALAQDARDTALEHLRHYLRVCPETTVEALVLSRFLPVAEIWRPRLETLRQRLRQESLRRQLWGLPRLWMLEFQVVPSPEHAAVRERVREDLEILRRHDRPDLSAWGRALEQGYKSTGDTEALARLEEGLIKARPCTQQAVEARFDRLEDRFPPPPPGEKPDPELNREALATASRWLAQCPDEFMYSAFHYRVALDLGTLSDDEILAEIDRHIAVWERNESRYGMFTTPWGKAAEELLERGLDPRRAVELAEKEVARADKEREDDLREVEKKTADGSEPESFWIRALRGDHSRVATHNTLLARARFAAGDAQGARRAVEAAESALVELRAIETTYPEELDPPQHDRYAGKLVAVLAEQAEREDRTADAFALYRRAAELKPDAEVKDRVRDLWTRLGGTDEGWQALARKDALRVAGETDDDVDSDEGTWQRRDEPLPDFELSGLEGKTWTPADLAGKTVLINLWATWCGPCRLELPHVQKVYEQIAEREDLTLVTLNADSNPGLIQPFLDRHGYGFPVVLAEAFLIDLYGGLSLPQTWIVDPAGTVRFRQRGFSPDLGDTWVEEALGHLESVAASSGKSPKLGD